MTIKSFARLAAFGWCAFASLTACDSIAGTRAGQADESFGESGNGLQILAHDNYFVAFATASTPSGAIYAAGSGDDNPAILKLDRNGFLDADFGVVEYAMPPGFSEGQFFDVHPVADGGIVAAGHTEKGDGTVGVACKIEASGKVDPAFAEDSPMPGCRFLDELSAIYSLDVTSDSGFVASGYKESGDSHISLAIVRMSATGKVDTDFANGTGAAHLPDNYTADSGALTSVVSANGMITTLAAVGDTSVIVRHHSNGTLDQTFAGSGALMASQFSRALGMIVTPEDSIVLAVVPSGGNARAVTLMKFNRDGSPSPDYNGSDSPPGQTRIDLCYASCKLLTSSLPASLVQLDDGRLLLGLSAYYEEISATRTLSLRVNLAGEPDTSFGDEIEDVPPGVGRSIAVPGGMSIHSSVLRGDRLTVVGNMENENGFRLVSTGFTGDRLFSDGFD